MPNTVERTARTEFILRGERVRPGQIVTLNPIELERFARAECVYADEARNAEVPVAELPETHRLEPTLPADRRAAASAERQPPAEERRGQPESQQGPQAAGAAGEAQQPAPSKDEARPPRGPRS